MVNVSNLRYLARLRCSPPLNDAVQAPSPSPFSGPGPNADPARFDREVAGLVSRTPPGRHRVVFLGSSTFTMWSTLDADLGHLDAVNHGFGGSQLSDCLHFLDPLVLAYSPHAVVLYGGDNDMANGKDSDRVIADYERLATRIFAHNAQTLLYWVSIKPSLARWHQFAAHCVVCDYAREVGREDPRRRFIDIRPAMLGADGQPRPELFLEDGLHLNTRAYAAWTAILRPRLRADLLGE